MSLGDELDKLRSLHERGVLTDAEFATAKSRVLGEPLEHDGGRRAGFLHRLHRSRTDRWLGGVCGGLASEIGIPSWSLRLAFVLATFLFGCGVLLYVLAWIFIPTKPATV